MTTDDANGGGRVTMPQLYEAIGSLEGKLIDRLDRLEATMRENYASRDLCDERHEGYGAALAAAVDKSEDDRAKLWQSIHDIEQQLKWGAGIVVTAFLGLIVYLIEGHI